MRFYYNASMNKCADREWVINYLLDYEGVESREEAESGLDICREYYGWYDCDVSYTIKEAFEYTFGGVYYVNPNKDGPH